MSMEEYPCMDLIHIVQLIIFADFFCADHGPSIKDAEDAGPESTQIAKYIIDFLGEEVHTEFMLILVLNKLD